MKIRTGIQEVKEINIGEKQMDKEIKTMDNYKFNDLRRFAYVLPELKKISRALNKLGVDNCNIGIEDDVYAKRELKLVRKAQEIADNFNLVAYHQSDPRGCSLYLLETDKQAESRYTDGIAIC